MAELDGPCPPQQQSVPRLGVAEEVTWRNVYMADNNNSIQVAVAMGPMGHGWAWEGRLRMVRYHKMSTVYFWWGNSLRRGDW